MDLAPRGRFGRPVARRLGLADVDYCLRISGEQRPSCRFVVSNLAPIAGGRRWYLVLPTDPGEQEIGEAELFGQANDWCGPDAVIELAAGKAVWRR